MTDFTSLALSPSLLGVVRELGYETPTAIQAEAIPALLDGKDLIGRAKTGSGKTAAFALPILEGLDLERRRLQALVVCPTRELSAQVAREFRKLGRTHVGLRVLVVSGGEPGRPQADALKRGVHVVVGTPGRLLDHLSRGRLNLNEVRVVVLDEADRMLDMGFREDMESMLNALPPSRQTVFFSATFPSTIDEMSNAYQREPLRIEIEEEAPLIREFAIRAKQDEKLHALYWALHEFPHESALVFCNLKASVRELDATMAAAGLSVDCLHGDLEQFERQQVLARFRNGSVRVLIATDVAARGIDVADLDLVINYEIHVQPEIYVHRIGRTGRAGKHGVAVSLASSSETRPLDEIMRLTGRVIAPAERDPDADPGASTLAQRLAGTARMATIQISGGRKDKVRPGDILGALTGDAAGLKGSDVGKIEIHDRLSYVAVSRSLSREAVDSLNAGRIKGRRFRASLLQRQR